MTAVAKVNIKSINDCAILFLPKIEHMEYTIEYNKIMAIAEEEVSREGAQAYSEDGVSLYDAIRMVSRDEEKKKRLMSEVLVLIKEQCNRFIADAELMDEGEAEPTTISFELDITSRRSAGKELSIKTLLRSLTVNLFLNRFFVSKNQAELATKYDTLALADVQTLSKLLYTKLPPVYPA